MKLTELREAIRNNEEEARDAALSAHPETLRATGNKHPWTVTASNHPRARAYVRHPLKDSEHWSDLYRKVARGLESGPKINGDYVAQSKSHGHGVVVRVDHDKRTMKVKTILSPGQTHATHEDDNKILVEQIVE